MGAAAVKMLRSDPLPGSGTALAAALWTQHSVWAKATLLLAVTEGSRGSCRTGTPLMARQKPP